MSAMFRAGWTLLELVESKSSPGKWYEVRKGGDGKVYCTCMAWRYSKGHVCRHIETRRARTQTFEPIADPKDVIAGRKVQRVAVRRGDVVEPRRFQ